MNVGRPRLANIGLPTFDEPAVRPELPAARYPERIEELRARMAVRGYDALVVWADREHSAGMSFLTGFDPRFEEALLVIGRDGEPAVLVGNENWGTAGAAPLPMRRHMFQDFSLPSQPRDRSRPLNEILGGEGIGRDLWRALARDYPRLTWRSRARNPIAPWYQEQCDGMLKLGEWNVYWRGLAHDLIPAAVAAAAAAPVDLE